MLKGIVEILKTLVLRSSYVSGLCAVWCLIFNIYLNKLHYEHLRAKLNKSYEYTMVKNICITTVLLIH